VGSRRSLSRQRVDVSGSVGGLTSQLVSSLLRRHGRSKSDPLCDEVLLLEANPSYAHTRYPNGREDTVSTSDLAPCPDIGIELSTPSVSTPEGESAETSCDVSPPTEPDMSTRPLELAAVPSSEEPQLPPAVPPLRRSFIKSFFHQIVYQDFCNFRRYCEW